MAIDKTFSNLSMLSTHLVFYFRLNGVLGHDSALVKGYAGLGTNWANEMNFVMKHAPGAGLIA